MSARSIKASRFSPTLAGYLAVALLLPSLPASAAGVAPHAPAPVWQLSIRNDAPLILSPKTGDEATGDLAMDDNRWTPSETSQPNAGVSRAVDRLINPPEHVDVFATQTGDAVHGRFQGNRPNETIAAFQLVIH